MSAHPLFARMASLLSAIHRLMTPVLMILAGMMDIALGVRDGTLIGWVLGVFGFWLVLSALDVVRANATVAENLRWATLLSQLVTRDRDVVIAIRRGEDLE